MAPAYCQADLGVHQGSLEIVFVTFERVGDAGSDQVKEAESTSTAAASDANGAVYPETKISVETWFWIR